MNDQDVIVAFVAYLAQQGHPGLEVEHWPDKENRDSSDIDAIAGPFAIEHTSVDTLPNQRGASARFMRVAGELKQEIQNKPPFRLRIDLEYDAIARGQDWGGIRTNLKNWIISEAPRLPDGCHVLDRIPGVPFTLHVRKDSSRRPNLVMGRFEPEDESLPRRIRDQFDRKVKKLALYQSRGKKTVLLVESEDLALMNEHRMLQAILRAYPNGIPTGVDEVWYADTSIPEEIEFFHFTDDLPGG